MKSNLTIFLFLTCVAAAVARPIEKVDPKALVVLQQMSNTLARASALTFQTRTISEVPADTGQSYTLFSDAEVFLRRPNKLAARLSGEAPGFNFYYDGSTVSAFAPSTMLYSKSPAPSSIDGMLPDLEEETGIRFATTPLLMSDPYKALREGLTSAVVVGQAMVRGKMCTHLAFRAPGVNWEIWIEANERALPRRLVVTFTDQKQSPTTIIDFSRWGLRPWLRDGLFEFQPPRGAKEIPFESVWKHTGR